MCWWCDDVKKNVIFRWGQKQAKNSHFEPLFRDPQKQPFLTIFRVSTSFDGFMTCWQQIFDDEMMLTTRWWWRWWRKVAWEAEKMTKIDPQQKPKKRSKMEPARAARTAERKGHKERLWRDRVREVIVKSLNKNKKKLSDGNRHVECERSDVRGVLRTCAAYLTWVTYPTRGTHESRRVRAQRVRAGITKVREDFFDAKFHDGTQISESDTRDHKNLTAPRVLWTTHCNRRDEIKKNLLMTICTMACMMWRDDGKFNNDMMISTISPKYEKKVHD
jgi:hypothetical protein